MTNVTEKSTKGVIWGAYQVALEKIEALQSQQLNPEAIAAGKKKAEVLKSAKTTVGTSVDKVVADLRVVVDAALTDLTSEFEGKKTEFANLDEAIKAKDAELAEIYEIERNANTLAALINSHEVLKAQQTEENAATLERFQEQLRAIRENIEHAETEYEGKRKEMFSTLRKDQQRAREEFEYDFAREKKIKEDELTDFIQSAEKDIAEQKQVLLARDAELTEREIKMNDLEDKVAEIPALIEAAKAEAADKAKKDTERSFVFEKRAIESNKDSEIRVLESRVQLLEEALASEKEGHKATAGKLEEAYGRLERVSIASVEGAKAQDTVTRLLSMNNEKSGK